MTDLKSEDKLLAGFSHVLIFFHLFGLVANLVIFLLHKDKSAYVARHVKQALGVQVGGIIFSAALGALGIGTGFGIAFGGWFNPVGLAFGGILVGLAVAVLTIMFLVCIVVAAIKGFSGSPYQYPIIGEFVDGIAV